MSLIWLPGNGGIIPRMVAAATQLVPSAAPTTVSAWLRNLDDSGAVPTWDNALNPANPAVQSTPSRQGTASSDFSITFDGGDDYALAIDAANFSRDALEVCLWYKPASVAGIQTLFAIRSIGNPDGASANAFDIRANGTGLQFDLWHDGTNGRRLSLSSVLTANVSVMITAAWNGALGTEAARQCISINGVIVGGGTYANIGTGGLTTQLTAATGNINIGSRSGVSLPIAAGGKLARNIFMNVTPMSGVTHGCWTDAARTAMFGFEALA